MSSKTEICNLALKRLGQGKIASLDEMSVAGVACNDLYDLSRRSVLAMHTWRFACKRATLSLLDETPDGYQYAYALPADCIHVFAVEPIFSNPPIEFKVFGDALWTGDPNGKIQYIWDIEDTNKFDPLFISALAWYLAADLVPSVTGKLDQQQAMLSGFGAVLRAAKGASAAAAKQPSRTGMDIRNSRQ